MLINVSARAPGMRRMKPTITRFDQDEVGDWVAELSCGHARHIRHRPPWQSRPWVLSAVSRAAMVGKELECGLCAQLQINDDNKCVLNQESDSWPPE